MKQMNVSVIMATHNNSLYLREAIESVLMQSYESFELIIINDASTDATDAVLAQAAREDPRIHIITNYQQRGLSVSLNRGIEQAQGTYIARIDSDDLWSIPRKLEKQVAFLDHHQEFGMVGSWGRIINQEGSVLSRLQYPVSDSEIRKYFLIENCFIHSSVLMRTHLVKSVGGYDERYRFAQDYDLWLRIGAQTKLHNLPFFMVLYRKNPEGMSKIYYKQQIQETIRTVKAHTTKYPYAASALLLWHARLYIPDSVRERISKLFRRSVFSNSFTHPPK